MIGQRVIYVNPGGGYEADDISILTLGQVYTVQGIEIMSDDIFLNFAEIPERWFNSVHFNVHYF